MANGIGDLKNGDMGPVGPKCNPMKQAAPMNAREYYTTKVLGVSNQKTKSPTHSPSAEPTDTSNTPDDYTQMHTSTTKSKTPQHPTKDNIDRPTTLTSNT